jgi:TolB protein
VTLGGTAFNCAVSGANPRSVEVVAGGTADVSFAVTCTTTTVTGQIAFTSSRDGYPEIYVMNADGSGLAQLTDDSAVHASPAWSPDGTKLAFVRIRDGNAAIYQMNADGSGGVRLTSGVSPAWSPDGTKIAFQNAGADGVNGQIYVMNADGSGVTQLTTLGGVNAAWSPDGSKIAFIKSDGISFGIYVMRSDGSSVVRLANGGDGVYTRRVAWSPDGSRIAFISGGSLLVMNSDGSSQTGVVASDTLGSGAGTLSSQSWSPDGSKIAFGFYWCGEPDPYLSCATDVAVVSVDGTSLRFLTSGGTSMEPAWRPTHSSLVRVRRKP